MSCAYCKDTSHVIANCARLKERNERWKVEKNTLPKNVNFVNFINSTVDPQFQRFCSIGALCKSDRSCRDVVLLGDSGSLQSLIRKDLLNDDEFFDTKEIRLIHCVNGIVSEISLVEVNLKSKYCNGFILLGTVDHLPDNVDF